MELEQPSVYLQVLKTYMTVEKETQRIGCHSTISALFHETAVRFGSVVQQTHISRLNITAMTKEDVDAVRIALDYSLIVVSDTFSLFPGYFHLSKESCTGRIDSVSFYDRV